MNDFIRNGDCISCTITDVSSDGKIQIGYSNFKSAKFPISFIVIYEYDKKYYYPITMEYRLIDNNILYLIRELKVNTMEECFKILSSSMLKEEKWTNEFKLALVHLNKKPNYCFELNNFSIGQVNMVEIYE